jgi:hypothetical protein
MNSIELFMLTYRLKDDFAKDEYIQRIPNSDKKERIMRIVSELQDAWDDITHDDESHPMTLELLRQGSRQPS